MYHLTQFIRANSVALFSICLFSSAVLFVSVPHSRLGPEFTLISFSQLPYDFFFNIFIGV